MIKKVLELRRIRKAIKYLQGHLEFYENLNTNGTHYYNKECRREMLNDLYKLKYRYNTKKFKWMRRA